MEHVFYIIPTDIGFDLFVEYQGKKISVEIGLDTVDACMLCVEKYVDEHGGIARVIIDGQNDPTGWRTTVKEFAKCRNETCVVDW